MADQFYLTDDVNVGRMLLRQYVSETQIGAAMGAYYALHGSGTQYRLVVAAESDVPLGYLVIAGSQLDLFHPLVILRTTQLAVAYALLEASLAFQKPYYISMPSELAQQLAPHWQPYDAELLHAYTLEARHFTPAWHPLVRQCNAADGCPRFEIRVDAGEPLAVAGVNWQSRYFAEIHVKTAEHVRGRGYGRAVVSALAAHILHQGRKPLYVVCETNSASLRLAQTLGFADSGEREYAGFITRPLVSNPLAWKPT